MSLRRSSKFWQTPKALVRNVSIEDTFRVTWRSTSSVQVNGFRTQEEAAKFSLLLNQSGDFCATVSQIV